MNIRQGFRRGAAVTAALLLSFAVSACNAHTREHHHRPAPTAPAPTAHVPDLEGLALHDARHRLRHNGFRIGHVGEKPSRHYRKGTVIGQYPEPWVVAKLGAKVDLVVAVPARPKRVEVPDLHGRPLAKARHRLEHKGLRLGTVRHEVTRAHPEGHVIAQWPKRGVVVRRHAHVDLVLARAPEKPKRTEVPNLKGLKLGAAKKALTRADLRLGQVREKRVDDHARDGRVIRQSAAPWSRIRRGKRVDIVVARARHDHDDDDDGGRAYIDVPSLDGLTVDKAERRLRKHGLRLGHVKKETTREARPGRVIAQSPRPGAEVRPGTRVDLIAARAPEKSKPKAKLRTVPSLAGLSVPEADKKLQRAGLRLGPTTFARDGGAAYSIIAQQPGPGARVKAKSKVTVVVVEPRD